MKIKVDTSAFDQFVTDKVKFSSFDDFEKEVQNVADNKPSKVEIPKTDIPKIGLTWDEFKSKTFPKSERVIFGLGRGQVGMINATTNIGKTTFALNLALSLATGAKFLPFTEGQTSPLRIMVIDGENTKAELQKDLLTMMRDWSPADRGLLDKNLLLVCDEYINDEPLELKNPAHVETVIETAKDFKPDLIIVDTMAALFSLQNENDNAEVKRYVITPLKILGYESNAAVLLLHHIGKQSEESFATNAAYSGRGGSNFGALSRTVIKLTTPEKTDKTRVVFTVAKSKGYRQEDVMMQLNFDTRWFTVSNEPPPKPITCYDEVVKFIKSEIPTKEVWDGLKGKFSKRIIEDSLHKAVLAGAIRNTRRGFYAPMDSAVTAEANSNSGKCGNESVPPAPDTPRDLTDDEILALGL